MIDETPVEHARDEGGERVEVGLRQVEAERHSDLADGADLPAEVAPAAQLLRRRRGAADVLEHSG